MARPSATVPMNFPNIERIITTSVISATFWAIRLQIPIGAYLAERKKKTGTE